MLIHAETVGCMYHNNRDGKNGYMNLNHAHSTCFTLHAQSDSAQKSDTKEPDVLPLLLILIELLSFVRVICFLLNGNNCATGHPATN